MVKAFDQFSGGVSFGGVSIGEKTARIGIRIDRGVVELQRADELFCDRRLTGHVVLGRKEDGNGQMTIAPDIDHKVEGVFDVKGFRCSIDHISIGVTFNLAEIDIAELAVFSKGEGRLVVTEASDIPEEEKDDEPHHVPGTLRADGPWREESLDHLFDPKKATRKALKKAGINTVGELADYSASEKRLTDIEGVGDSKANEIEERMIQFWADNEEAKQD
jgi:hypothetical protein